MLICVFLMSQHRNDNWCFGDSSGINFLNKNAPSNFLTSVQSRGSCCSISDSTGLLQFYYSYDAKGALGPGHQSGNVYNKLGSIMLNGDSLISGGWYFEGIIVPSPIAINLFYLFNVGVTGEFGLYYSLIDISLNNGNGAVTQKNIQLQPEPANDGLVAMKHGNGRDWWVIHRRNGAWGAGVDNTFFKYLVTATGVALNDTQNIGSVLASNGLTYTFNKQGNKLAMCAWAGVIETFDFDRCTGQLSNHVLIHPKDQSNNYSEFVSCEWSASGRFLYVSTNGAYDSVYVVQIDMQNPNLYGASDTVFSLGYPIASGGIMKRAPDDKIYFSCSWYDGTFNFPYPDSTYNMYNMNLSVINAPDSLGAACNFTPFSFYLGGSRTYYGLPNNPNYDMGPDTGSVCDSLGLSSPPAPQRAMSLS